jgi:hypothetical protein
MTETETNLSSPAKDRGFGRACGVCGRSKYSDLNDKGKHVCALRLISEEVMIDAETGDVYPVKVVTPDSFQRTKSHPARWTHPNNIPRY